MFRSTDLAHTLLRGHLQAGDWVVDATLGNGHDALFLKRAVNPDGRLFAFDTQLAAVEASRRLFESGGESMEEVEFHHLGHEHLATVLPPEARGKIAAVMFNLGYLPHGDPALITTTSTTVQALASAREWLRPGGLISVVAYPGHAGGAEEGEAVRDLMLQWKPAWRVYEYRCLSAESPAPYLLLAVKLKICQ